MSIEKAKGILAVFKNPLTQQEQAHVAWQFCTEYGDKLLAVFEAAEQAVGTIDKLMELTGTYINVNISGKDYRFEATKELKQKLAALDQVTK